jgi:hypothetical protein
MGSPNVIDGVQINVIGNVTPFAQAMDKAAAIARSQGKAIKDALNKEIHESNHSLGLFGEAFGVTIPRHIRTFISTLPGVSKAMSAAFNAVAILVVIDVLVKAGEKVKKLAEAYGEAHEASRKMGEGTKDVTEKLEVSGRALIVQTDHLQKMIDKLEHKPHNGLKDALDEAAERADNLVAKLKAAFDEEVKVLKEGEVGILGQMVGKSGNSDVTKITQDTQKAIHDLPRDGNIDAATAAIVQKAWRQLEAMRMSAVRRGGDNHGLIDSIYSAQANLSSVNEYVDTDNTHNDKQKQADVDEAKHTADTAALAARKKADEQERRLIGIRLEGLADANAKYARLLQLPTVRPGNTEWAYGVMNPDTGTRQGGEFAKARMEAHKEDDEQDKKDAEELNRYNEKLNATADRLSALNERDARSKEEYIRKAAEVALKWAAFAEKMGASHSATTGAITSAHTAEFNDLLKVLNGDLARIAAEKPGARTPEQLDIWNTAHKDNLAKANGAISSATDTYKLQHAEDLAAQASQTASAGLSNFFSEFERDADNAANAVHSALTTAMNGVNTELTNALMGKKTNWSKAFAQTGSSMIQSGLKMGESGIMKAFGLGKVQKVEVVNMPGGGLGGAASSLAPGISNGLASFLKKIGGFFGGFFADGGSPDPYKTSIVGENGPELFTPKVAGTITPNKSLRNALGGGGSFSPIYNIDATGTNAAEVDMRVRAGMVQAHNQAVNTTMLAQAERSKRMPSGRRG